MTLAPGDAGGVFQWLRRFLWVQAVVVLLIAAMPTDVSADNATTTAAPVTTTVKSPPATTTQTSVPNTAVPSVFTSASTAAPAFSKNSLQFQSRFSLGQLTSDRLTLLVATLASMFQTTVNQVSIQAFLDSKAATTVRVTVTSPQSLVSLQSTLTTAASNTTTALYTVIQPLAQTIQVVPSCTQQCSVSGTVSAARNSDNTACVCTCANKWSGTSCSVCSYPYTGNECNQCAAGTVGYPTCYALPNCTQPSVPRYSQSWSSACAASQSQRGASNCAQAQCMCLGGQFDLVTRLCYGSVSNDTCLIQSCAGTAARCQFAFDVQSLQRSSSCVNETTATLASMGIQSSWCAFDACVTGSSSLCGTSATAACSMTYITNGATGLRLGIVQLLLVALTTIAAMTTTA